MYVQARATALTVGVLQRSDLALLLLDGRYATCSQLTQLHLTAQLVLHMGAAKCCVTFFLSAGVNHASTDEFVSYLVYTCATGLALARRILRWQTGYGALWTRQYCWQPTSASVARQAFLVCSSYHNICLIANVASQLCTTMAAPAGHACVSSYSLLDTDVGDVLAEATRLGFGDPVAVSAETGVHHVH